MISVIACFCAAVLLAALTTPLVRRVAMSLGAIDEPSARRVNQRRIPRLGGIAIVAGFFVPLLGLFALNTTIAQLFFSRPRLVAGLAGGALLICGLGVLDDIVGVGAKRKLAVQTLAASVAFAAGFQIEALQLPFVGAIEMRWLSYPTTVLWIVAVVNALNLIDGLDGLAAGVAFFACITNFVIALMGHDVLICLLSSTLAGALLGFLVYNFNPATIFMGDSGSMFLGFVLATMSIYDGSSAHKSTTAIAIVVPLLSLGLPIIDMLFAMVRRFLERRPIFSPDRGHIHHRLLDVGLTHRRAVLFLYCACLLFTVGALAMQFGNSWQIGVTLLALSASVFALVRFVSRVGAEMRGRQDLARVQATTQLRRAVLDFLTRVAGARPDDVSDELERFATNIGLRSLRMIPPQTIRARAITWSSAVPSQTTVSETFSAGTDAGATLDVTFEWQSDANAPRPEEALLFQLVVDGCYRAITQTPRARGHLRSV